VFPDMMQALEVTEVDEYETAYEDENSAGDTWRLISDYQVPRLCSVCSLRAIRLPGTHHAAMNIALNINTYGQGVSNRVYLKQTTTAMVCLLISEVQRSVFTECGG
jgi:hypothetical protein